MQPRQTISQPQRQMNLQGSSPGPAAATFNTSNMMSGQYMPVMQAVTAGQPLFNQAGVMMSMQQPPVMVGVLICHRASLVLQY